MDPVDFLHHLINSIPNALALTINMYHAGFNMIPRAGFEQALEAFVFSKGRK